MATYLRFIGNTRPTYMFVSWLVTWWRKTSDSHVVRSRHWSSVEL